MEEHLRGLGLPIVVFADIRVDERKWPWPWMLGGCEDKVVIIDIPQTEDGTVDVEFLKTQLGKQLYKNIAIIPSKYPDNIVIELQLQLIYLQFYIKFAFFCFDRLQNIIAPRKSLDQIQPS